MPGQPGSLGITRLVHDATASAVGYEEPQTIELDELCRMAAKEMLAVALLAERRAYLDEHAAECDATGHRLVVANDYARPREVVTGAGAIEVTARGSTTAGRVSGSAQRSCRPTCASPPRSPRSSRASTCADSQPGTSPQHWASELPPVRRTGLFRC